MVYGIDGYMLIDRWNLLDSFYMVIITISTVGYGEIHPPSAAGRIFTSTLIVTGVAGRDGTLFVSPSPDLRSRRATF